MSQFGKGLGSLYDSIGPTELLVGTYALDALTRKGLKEPDPGESAYTGKQGRHQGRVARLDDDGYFSHFDYYDEDERTA